ncbi:MAG: hypothetical protein VKK42_16805 [Lyngbya sp.]|nr:hypothetical protein [Lyngbya sp.]
MAKRLHELLENQNYAVSTEIGRMIQEEDGVSLACDGIEKHL